MASVIHHLWEQGNRSPLILPGDLALDDGRVQSELTRYLDDNWAPIIERDVDGADSLPLRIDSEQPNLGKFSAGRRVARAIFLGSAPTTGAAHRGIEDRRVKLGCVMPGESPAVFGDALRRLATAATYLYEDNARYWYATQPTVTKLAEDRAEQMRRNPDRIVQEIGERMRADLRQFGDFSRVHAWPHSGHDVPDDPDARLVVLGIEHPYGKGGESAAEKQAQQILESRGTAPRIYRNALVFLAADTTRLQELDEAVRRFLAWESIVAEREQLNLGPPAGASGGDAARHGRGRGHLTDPRDLPLAAGAGAEHAAGSGHVGCGERDGHGSSGRTRCPQAQGSGGARHRLCLHAAADGVGSRPPLAGRPCVHRPACRGLCPLPVPAKASGSAGSVWAVSATA